MSIDDIKSRLADIAGVQNLTMQTLGGRDVYSIAGRVVGVPVGADASSIETAIRTAIASPDIVTAIPMAQGSTAQPVQAPKPSSPSGGLAASLKAMLASARAGVEQAKADGMAKVQDAVTKLGEAQTAVTHVTSSMAKTIHDEADSVMAELGQISNDLTGEA